MFNIIMAEEQILDDILRALNVKEDFINNTNYDDKKEYLKKKMRGVTSAKTNKAKFYPGNFKEEAHEYLKKLFGELNKNDIVDQYDEYIKNKQKEGGKKEVELKEEGSQKQVPLTTESSGSKALGKKEEVGEEEGEEGEEESEEGTEEGEE